MSRRRGHHYHNCQLDRRSAVRGIAISKKMVAAAQAAHGYPWHGSVSDAAMARAIKAALDVFADNKFHVLDDEPRAIQLGD